MTLEEVADLLRSKTSHVRSLIFKEEIPYFKVGRLIRFDKKQIIEWIVSSQKTKMSKEEFLAYDKQ